MTNTLRWLLLGCAGAAQTVIAQSDPYAAARAAASAAATRHSACTKLPSFYWEIGSATQQRIASGARGTFGGLVTTEDAMRLQDLSLDSASKWLYGAYVVQKRANAGTPLGAADIAALTMRSGYSYSYQCLTQTTVRACFEAGDYSGADGPPTPGAHNDTRDVGDPPLPDTRFYYASGHFQKHATVDMGLGAISKTQLDDELRTTLGTAVPSAYDAPQLAAAARGSAADYAGFLQKLLDGSLALSQSLYLTQRAYYTCADARDPKNCPLGEDPQSSPASMRLLGTDEHWFYSLGYWIEGDPLTPAYGTGDGAFSSPGAAGFYPWIDRNLKYYGILAREAVTAPFAAFPSVECGREIRRAWLSAAP